MDTQANAGMGPSALVFFEGEEKPRQYVIFHSALVKGQCPRDVFATGSLQLEYSFLDREVCEIFARDGKWFFKNLSEEAFVFAGGKNLEHGQETALRDGCVIRMVNGRMLTCIFFENYVSSTDWRFLDMDREDHEIYIQDRSGGGDPVGMTLSYRSGRWSMTYMSEKAVLHNGKPVSDRVPITIDDCIQIEDTRFFFEGSGLVYGYPLQQSSLKIEIDERSVHGPMRKKILLKDISLTVEPGSMILILGGSGAGKSTFVNAVTGYEKAEAKIVEGDIDFYRDYDRVKYQIGFVPQDNLLREDDTVGSTIRNAADMRLPRDMKTEEKEKQIAACLETFGLSGRESELVSRLSGGQKKRLSICTEFIASPSLFILDEPDSGLDGIMATELMENLRLIACQGRMVMVITHSPDRVAELFDKVIVLAKSSETDIGQMAFYGGIQEARDFFGADSMEGIVRLINAPNEGGEGRSDEFIRKYAEYAAVREETAKKRAVFRQGFDVTNDGIPDIFEGEEETDGERKTGPKNIYKSRLGQIPVYLGKQFRLLINERNWKVLPMAALIAYLVSYVLGERMFRNMEFTKYGSLAVICVCIWNGMFNSIQAVCKERSIIKREHRTGLHISSYLAAHVIYQALICSLQVVITIAIFRVCGMYFPETGLVTGSFTLDLGIGMFLVTFAADMLALMVSCIARTTTAAMTIMPFLLVVQLVFAGGVFPLSRPMAGRLSRLTLSSWGIRAVNITADYNGQKSIAVYTALDSFRSATDELMVKINNVMNIPEIRERIENYTADRMQVADFAYTEENLYRCWGVLLSFALIYLLIGLIFLEMIDRDKR